MANSNQRLTAMARVTSERKTDETASTVIGVNWTPSTSQPAQSEKISSENQRASSKPENLNATDLLLADCQHQPSTSVNQSALNVVVTSSTVSNQDQHQAQWLAQVAAQTQQGVRQRMSQASDQLGHSLRQLYASASSITSDVPPAYQNIPGIVPYYHGRSIGPPPSYDDVINPYAPPPTYQSLFGQMREARKTSRSLFDLMRRLLIIFISTLGCTILIAFMLLIPFTMIIVGATYIDECKIEHIPAFLLLGGLVWASKNIIHCYAQCRKVEQQEQSDVLAAELYLNASNSPAEANNNQSGPLSPSSSSSATNPSSSRETRSEQVSAGDASATPGGDQSINELQLSRQIMGRVESTTTDQPSSQQQQQQQRTTSRFKSSVCESLLDCILFGWFIAGCVIVFRNYEPDFENPTSARYCHRTVYMYTFWLITSAILSSGLFIGCICCLMVSSAMAGRQRDIDLA